MLDVQIRWMRTVVNFRSPPLFPRTIWHFDLKSGKIGIIPYTIKSNYF